MADVINRTTLEQFFSVDTPLFPTTEFIINPDLTLLFDASTNTFIVLKKYWKIEGDLVLEMTQAEKDVVDATPPPTPEQTTETQVTETGDEIIVVYDSDGVLTTQPSDLSEEPKQYLVDGINVQKGEVIFDNQKKVKIDFENAFKTIPVVNIGLYDKSGTPPFVLSVTKDHFFARFTQKFSGTIAWRAEA